MFTGSVAADTVYYFFASYRNGDGVVDYGFDTSAIAANIPTGYGPYKLVSRLLTDSGSQLIDSVQGVFEESYAVTFTQNAILVHGLGVIPDFIKYELIIRVADGGYVVGDVVPITPQFAGHQAQDSGFSVTVYDTNIEIETIDQSRVFELISKTSNDFTVEIGVNDAYLRVTAKS